MKTPNTRSAYFPYVDGLRAIAVIAVVIYHLNPRWLPGGFSGVDIFFVISGFIVSASVGAFNGRGILSFIGFFYARRLQRIGPALVACLLATALASAIFIPAAWLSGSNPKTGLFAFFGLSNFILAANDNNYFSPISEFNPYTHTWSLGVEEQFYFIFPLIFFAWICAPRWRLLSTATFVAALLASLFYSAWLGQTDKTEAFYMITSRFWQLAAGVLLFQAMTFAGRRFDIAEQPSPSWFTVGALISLGLLGYGFWISDASSFPFPGAAPSVIGALGLLGFLHGKGANNPIVKLLANRPVLFVGRISYSLYLWHWPVFVLFRWTVGIDSPLQRAVAATIAIVLAVASYYLIETPVRQLRIARRAPRYAVVTIGLVILGASAWIATQINDKQPWLSVSTITRNADDWYPYGSNTSPDLPGCVVHAAGQSIGTGVAITYTRHGCERPALGPRVFAIGDSHAIGYEAMYKGYVLASGAPVTVYNNGGCPFISLQPWRENTQHCKENAAAAVSHMLENIQSDDVLFLPSLRMPRFADQWVRFKDEEVSDAIFSEWSKDARQKAVEEANAVLKQFQTKGVRLVLEAPKPVFRSPTFRCAETYNQTNSICSDGLEIDRSEIESLRKPALTALQEIATSYPGATLWDPFAVLCPSAERCSAIVDGRPLFFDGDHVSGYGNRLLVPSFQLAVTKENSEPIPTMVQHEGERRAP